MHDYNSDGLATHYCKAPDTPIVSTVRLSGSEELLWKHQKPYSTLSCCTYSSEFTVETDRVSTAWRCNGDAAPAWSNKWPFTTLWLTDKASKPEAAHKHASSDSTQNTWLCCFWKQQRSALGLYRSNREFELKWCTVRLRAKLSVSTPQWGAADVEIKVPSGENTELKRSPFKAWSRSVYSHTCYAYCHGFLPCLFLHFRSIHLHFFPNLSRIFSCVGCG